MTMSRTRFMGPSQGIEQTRKYKRANSAETSIASAENTPISALV